MQLNYRGSHYNVTPSTTETVETEMTGVYRGVAHKITAPAQVTTRQSFKLTYRGIQY